MTEPLQKTSFTLSMFQTILIVIGMLISVGTFIGLSQSRMNNAELEINTLKNIELSNVRKELVYLKDQNGQTIYNQILIFTNLRKLMKSQGVEWENTLPDNYIDLIK